MAEYDAEAPMSRVTAVRNCARPFGRGEEVAMEQSEQTGPTEQTGQTGQTDPRRRTTMIVVPAIVLLVVFAGIGARLLWAGTPDDRTAADVTCWDRTTRPVDECPELSGVVAVGWLFPTFKPQQDSCVNLLEDSDENQREQMWRCRVQTKAGAAEVVYSQLKSVDQAMGFYDRTMGSGNRTETEEAGEVVRYVWRDGKKAAVLYADVPFSAEVSAKTERARDGVVDSFLRFRSKATFRVRP